MIPFGFRNLSRQLFSIVLAISVLLTTTAIGQDNEPLGVEDPPWAADQDNPRLPAVAQTSPRDALVGVDASEIDLLVDGSELEDNNETLLKILFRLPQISLGNVERFVEATESVDLNELPANSLEYRTAMFRLRGRAKKIEVVPLYPEIAERFDFPGYFRVDLEIDEVQHPVTLLARRVPDCWRPGEALDEPIEVDGMYIHWYPDGDDPTRLLFAGSRVRWYPQQGTPFAQVNRGQLLLAEYGMDASQFESMGARDRRSLELEDSESFFQMLSAVSKIADSEAQFEPGSALELFSVLREPNARRGDRFAVRGNIRRITRVDVTDDYIASRLKVDHYYQIDMFVRLEQNQIVRLKTTDGKEGPAYTNKFPITVCVPRLPEGVVPTDDINVQAELYAHFFKLWAYPSQYAEQYDPNLRQIGPLFVGHDVTLLEQSGSTTFITWIAGFILLVSLGGAWWGASMLGKRKSDLYVQPQRPEADAAFLKELQDRP